MLSCPFGSPGSISAGHDVLHTTDLPDGNRTADGRIAALADDEDRVVVTKDRDFRDGHLLSRSPRRLLVVAPPPRSPGSGLTAPRRTRPRCSPTATCRAAR